MFLRISIYFNYFGNYSYMYGSLTAVVILMLWLYACICILFSVRKSTSTGADNPQPQEHRIQIACPKHSQLLWSGHAAKLLRFLYATRMLARVTDFSFRLTNISLPRMVLFHSLCFIHFPTSILGSYFFRVNETTVSQLAVCGNISTQHTLST